MHAPTAGGTPKPDPADDRPAPADPGTPQRPSPRADAAVDPGGTDTARLADVPLAPRHGGGDAHRDDESKQPDTAADADEIRASAAGRGIAAAIAGIDIVPAEDR